MVKRMYVKPAICFDSFELCTGIAAECEMIGSNQESYACPVLIPQWGLSIFIDLTNCNLHPPEQMDTICYHVPTADNNVFNS